jgi:hypothetical protein
MDNKVVTAYITKGIVDEKDFLNTVNVLDVFAILGLAILGIAGLLLIIYDQYAYGIALLILAYLNYVTAKFFTGVGRTLINIQRANIISMLNNSKFNTNESFNLLNESLVNKTTNTTNNMDTSKNYSEILAEELRVKREKNS